MMTHYSTDQVIEELVASRYGSTASQRQNHVYREALRALVRLAKMEQLCEMRQNVHKLTGDPVLDLHHSGESK